MSAHRNILVSGPGKPHLCDTLGDWINAGPHLSEPVIFEESTQKTAIKELLEAHLRRVEHDKAGFAFRLYPFTRKRELDEPRIVVIDPFISSGHPVVARQRFWSAPGSEAPRRFGFRQRGTYVASVSTAVGERSKAPSPLRSAGAVQKLAASRAHGVLQRCLKKRRPGHTLRHLSFQFVALISSPPEHISKPTTSAVRNDCGCVIVVY